MISAKDLCRILAHAPKITTAAPTQTITFTNLLVAGETPAIIDFVLVVTEFYRNGKAL
jgi:hypothetical protein